MMFTDAALIKRISYFLRWVARSFPLVLGILIVLVPLIPFQFLDLRGIPSPLVGIVRFFPFVLILTYLMGRWLTKQTIGNQEDHLYGILIASTFLSLSMSSLVSPKVGHSFLRSIYYFVTGEMIFWLIIDNIEKKRVIFALLGLNSTTAFLVSAIGIAEDWGGMNYLRNNLFSINNPWFSQFNQASWKVYSTIGNPNPLGSYLCLSLPFFWFFALYGRTKVIQFASSIGGGATCVALYLTYSRGTWLAFVTGLLILAAVKFRKFIPFIIITFLIVVVFSIQQGKMYNPYVEMIEDYKKYHRTRSFEFIFQTWQIKPLLGIGTGNYRFYSKPLGSENDTPDNTYLLILAETGILGIVLLMGIVRKIILDLYQKQKEGRRTQDGKLCDRDIDLLLCFIISLICFLVNMFSWDALYFPVTRILFWIMAGLAVSFSSQIHRPESRF
jgi:putative inorganic carbon (hco3(-)) transporter